MTISSSKDHVARVFEEINEQNIEFVDLRFTDSQGSWHTLSIHRSTFKADIFQDGTLFDGSSIKGWKQIHDSDMLLMPDPTTMLIDPFASHPTLIIVCDVYEPGKAKGYGKDPRSTALRAMQYMKKVGVADEARFGPEPEFFVFDDMRFEVEPHRSFFEIAAEEAPISSDKVFDEGNSGQRPMANDGYFASAPLDMLRDLRAEMIHVLDSIGIKVEKHHHEVATCQHELGFRYGDAILAADHFQMFKYVIKNVAHIYGKTATFMPKPIFNENGSGMHVHQSLWKNGKNLFSGDKYAGLSDMALYYIGGVLKHGRALNAFTNPTTNSYKRLVPGFEAPVNLVYSASNRSAACRIPFVSVPEARRVEMRFPDPTANPYLAFSAMLMAGLDGIENKIHPGEAMEKNLFDLDREQSLKIPCCARTLKEALASLDEDREFLTKGGVYTNAQIDSYIEVKQAEVNLVDETPNPMEFKLYFAA